MRRPCSKMETAAMRGHEGITTRVVEGGRFSVFPYIAIPTSMLKDSSQP